MIQPANQFLNVKKGVLFLVLPSWFVKKAKNKSHLLFPITLKNLISTSTVHLFIDNTFASSCLDVLDAFCHGFGPAL